MSSSIVPSFGGGPMPSITHAVEDYLKAIWKLSHQTGRGKVPVEIVRHHRLWELYLYTRLGVPLERVDKEAERLEHVLSDDMEDLLARALGDPKRDPHGDPIPTKAGAMERLKGVP